MCVCVRGAPLQDRHALHVLLHAIEEVVHVSFVRQAEAPALALQEPLVGFGAQHIARGLDPPRWSSARSLQAPSWRRLVWVWVFCGQKRAATQKGFGTRGRARRCLRFAITAGAQQRCRRVQVLGRSTVSLDNPRPGRAPRCLGDFRPTQSRRGVLFLKTWQEEAAGGALRTRGTDLS